MGKVVRAYQGVILASLVILWGGVLPWLCWGGWSSPHHPHTNPHFVFAAPVANGTPMDSGQHAHPSPHAHPAHHDHATPDNLAGVARPDTLLLALLVIIFPSDRMVGVPRLRHFVRVLISAWAHATALLVPTPPPRLRRLAPHYSTQ